MENSYGENVSFCEKIQKRSLLQKSMITHLRHKLDGFFLLAANRVLFQATALVFNKMVLWISIISRPHTFGLCTFIMFFRDDFRPHTFFSHLRHIIYFHSQSLLICFSTRSDISTYQGNADSLIVLQLIIHLSIIFSYLFPHEDCLMKNNFVQYFILGPLTEEIILTVNSTTQFIKVSGINEHS